MNCREAAIKISLHVGDDLPEHEVPAVEEHLESCSLCREEYESYASSRDALLSLREDRGGLDLWDGVVAALDGGVAAPRRPWWRRVGALASVAATLALLVGASAWVPGLWPDASPVAPGDATVGVERVGGEPSVDGAGDAGPMIERPSHRELLEFLGRNGMDARTPADAADEDATPRVVAQPASHTERRQF